MESGRNLLSSKTIKVVVGVIIGVAVTGAAILVSSQKPTENRGLLGINRRPTVPLPDGIGPRKLGMTQEELDKIRSDELDEIDDKVLDECLAKADPAVFCLSGRPWYTQCQFTYDFMNERAFSIRFGTCGGLAETLWGDEVIKKTIERYGEPAHFTSQTPIEFGTQYRLVWRDRERELVWEFTEVPNIGGREIRAKRPFLREKYSGSLTGLHLQAEHDKQEQRVKEESGQKAKEELERDKAEAVKKLY